MKRWIVLTVAALSAVLMLLTGCDSSRDPMFVINEACSGVTGAAQVVATSSVTREDLLITETQKTYVKEGDGLSLTTVTTVLNELPAEEAYSVTSSTQTLEGGFTALSAFSTANFADYEISEEMPVVLTARLSADQAEAQFGVRPEADGEISLTVRLDGSNRLERIEMTYRTLSGSQAAVTVTFGY